MKTFVFGSALGSLIFMLGMALADEAWVTPRAEVPSLEAPSSRPAPVDPLEAFWHARACAAVEKHWPDRERIKQEMCILVVRVTDPCGDYARYRPEEKRRAQHAIAAGWDEAVKRRTGK